MLLTVRGFLCADNGEVGVEECWLACTMQQAHAGAGGRSKALASSRLDGT